MGSADNIYRSVFREYPDVMDVRQVSALLGVSIKTVYKLLRDGSIISLKVGREFRVPKINVMKYIKLIAAEK
jgi:excisionase family DNA binding protein